MSKRIKVVGVIQDAASNLTGFRLVSLDSLGSPAAVADINLKNAEVLYNQCGFVNCIWAPGTNTLNMLDGNLSDLPVFVELNTQTKGANVACTDLENTTNVKKGDTPLTGASDISVLKNSALVIVAEVVKNAVTQGYYVIDTKGVIFPIDFATLKLWAFGDATHKPYQFYNIHTVKARTLDILDITEPQAVQAKVQPAQAPIQQKPAMSQKEKEALLASKKKELEQNIANEAKATRKFDAIASNTSLEVAQQGATLVNGTLVVRQTEVDNAGEVTCSVDGKTKSTLQLDGKFLRTLISLKSARAFYYALVSGINRYAVSSIDTAAVTHDTLLYNPKFMASLHEAEFVFILIHEVMHLTMLHHSRRGNRDPYVFNLVCDLYINALICKEFGLTWEDCITVKPLKEKTSASSSSSLDVGILPVSRDSICGIYSHKLNLESDCVENMYTELLLENPNLITFLHDKLDSVKISEITDPQELQEALMATIRFRGEVITLKLKDPNQESDDGESDASGGDMGWSPDVVETYPLDTEPAERERKAKQIIANAITVTGHLEGCALEGSSSMALRLAQEALAPKIDWRSVIRTTLRKLGSSYMTLAKPDRRFVHDQKILPGKKKIYDGLDKVFFCIDTSGSISDKDIGIVLKQIKQMLKVFKQVSAKVIYWDNTVNNVESLEGEKDYERFVKTTKAKGGGGTDCNVVFDYLKTTYKINLNSALLEPYTVIIFTDGYFGKLREEYKKFRDTLFVIQDNKNFTAPFGRAIHVKTFNTDGDQ